MPQDYGFNIYILIQAVNDKPREMDKFFQACF